VSTVTVDEGSNVSLTVEGDGDTETEELIVSLDKYDEVKSIVLKAGVEFGNS